MGSRLGRRGRAVGRPPSWRRSYRRTPPPCALSFGVLEHYYGWNTSREERLCRLAIERNPAGAEGYFWLCLCLAFDEGRTEEALSVGREGVRLEPHSANIRATLAWPYIYVGRYEEAAAELSTAVALEGSAPYALWTYGIALTALGRHEEGIAVHRRRSR